MYRRQATGYGLPYCTNTGQKFKVVQAVTTDSSVAGRLAQTTVHVSLSPFGGRFGTVPRYLYFSSMLHAACHVQFKNTKQVCKQNT